MRPGILPQPSDSIPLITASILAKKLAEGLDALVMDVKVGSGAFMPTYELSEALAEAIVGVANGAGVRTTALLTDMNQVLASSAGNAVEVREAVQFLTGEYRNPRLFDVTMALCVEMLISGKLATDDAEARAKLQAVLDNGKAAEVFGRMVAAQKGPTDFVENYAKYLPTAMLTKAVYADTDRFSSVKWIPARWGWQWLQWAAVAVRHLTPSITASALLIWRVWATR